MYATKLSQILVNMIKSVLPLLVSKEQSAFVSGRAMMDNILLAQKVLHSMRNKSEGKKLMVLKLNMEKAYDMMTWDFIQMAMSKFGFDMKSLIW